MILSGFGWALHQLRQFLPRELAVLADGEVSQGEVSNSSAYELHHTSAQGFDHSADLAIPSFHQNQFEE
jgi:hypothetical protein